MIPLLLHLLQSQQAEIEKLEDRINNLESK
jgi:hypothetical protein